MVAHNTCRLRRKCGFCVVGALRKYFASPKQRISGIGQLDQFQDKEKYRHKQEQNNAEKVYVLYIILKLHNEVL